MRLVGTWVRGRGRPAARRHRWCRRGDREHHGQGDGCRTRIRHSPNQIASRNRPVLEQVRDGQFVEGILDDRLVGRRSLLGACESRKLLHGARSVALAPHEARQPIEQMCFLPALVVDDRLVADLIDEELTSS